MPLSREELWSALDGASKPLVAPLINDAYTLELHREWSIGDHNPHGHPWHTSFHASAFPGKEQNACGRFAVYNLLDPPAPEPIKPFLKAWFDLGLNLEHDWVRRLNAYGVLLSQDVNQEDVDFQTGFRDEEHWLTGASDAIVLNPERRQAHCVEVKTTSHEKVLKMINSNGADVPKAHAKYLRQLGTYIALAHEAPYSPRVTVCKISGLLAVYPGANPFELPRCPCQRLSDDKPHELLHDGPCELEEITVAAPVDGTLIYSSREEPMTVASFNVRYDRSFMDAGRAKLAAWKQAFIDEKIPDHPLAHAKAKWSVDPCQFCPLKKHVCKPDFTGHNDDLRSSDLIGYAQSIDPSWDYDEKRNAVLARWNTQREEHTPA